MISTNVLSLFIIHNHLNKIGNKNLRSIQEVRRASKPAAEKYKMVCKDFPNITILTKSATPGKVHLRFIHTAVGNKSLLESVVDFTLAGDLRSLSVIYLKIDIAFASDGNDIHLPIAVLSF